MPPLLNSAGAVLLGAALVLSSGPARAAPVAPAALVPALDVYIDALVAGHSAAGACAPATSPARDEAAWVKGKAILVASLWANGFPVDFVRTATQRLDAPPAAATKPNCADPALAGELGWPDQSGWVEVMTAGLKGMSLSVVAEPVEASTWAGIKGLIAKLLPDEKRLLDCNAVMYPETLPSLVHDWDEMIGKIGVALAAAGLPRDEVGAALGGAEANQLWHRVAADAEAALRDSCRGDKAVEAALANFGYGGLATEVEKLLPKAASGSN
jgi:hypothetical protein